MNSISKAIEIKLATDNAAISNLRSENERLRLENQILLEKLKQLTQQNKSLVEKVKTKPIQVFVKEEKSTEVFEDGAIVEAVFELMGGTDFYLEKSFAKKLIGKNSFNRDISNISPIDQGVLIDFLIKYKEPIGKKHMLKVSSVCDLINAHDVWKEKVKNLSNSEYKNFYSKIRNLNSSISNRMYKGIPRELKQLLTGKRKFDSFLIDVFKMGKKNQYPTQKDIQYIVDEINHFYNIPKERCFKILSACYAIGQRIQISKSQSA